MAENNAIKGFYTLIIMLLCNVVIGQGNIKKEGEEYFKNEKYAIALNFFDRVKDANEDNEILYKRAICNYHINKLSISKGQLTQAFKKGFEDPEIFYYMAKTHHASGDYAMAAKFYKKYLNKVRKDKETREEVTRLIKQCAYGINHQYNNEIAFVENLGEVINTRHDDLNPIQSNTNSNKYYFSSGRSGATGGLRNKKGYRDEFYGSYFYDIYSTEIVNGSWEYPESVDDLLNTSNHEMMLDISKDGSEVYFLRSRDLELGTIEKKLFTKDSIVLKAEAVISPVVGELGDVYLKVFNDSTYIFSSNRVGGYGGYDLYMTISRDGQWSDAINMGPEINGQFNEVSPFVTNNGKSIYFSSDRLESYGGFDVFGSDYTVEGAFWSEAHNLGQPINSPGNDMHYMITADGNTALLSSDRKTGYGGFDIYIAYLKDQNKSQLIRSRSIPFLDYLEYEAGIDSSTMSSEAQELVDSHIDDENTIIDEIKVDRPERGISISPLYYGDDDNLFQPKNNIVINDLIDLMRIYPEISIMLTSHSIREGLREFDLYFSIKRAEKMQEHLVSKGISKERILLRGVGSNYPLVKVISAGQTTNIAKTINRRLDIEILDIGSLPITVVEDNPVVVDYLQDKKFQIFETLMEGVSFRVKIAQVKQLYKNDVLSDYEDIVIDKEGEFYSYTVGLYSDFFSALKVKNQLANKNFAPKIRAYLNGVWMTEQQIQEMAPENLELKRYIDHRN